MMVLPGAAAYALAAALLALLLVILSLFVFLFCKRRWPPSPPCGTAEEASVTALLRAGPVPMSELEAATDGFHHSRLIGKGCLGAVYEASAGPGAGAGRAVAIKRLHPHVVLSRPGPGFSVEMKCLSGVASHPNVVAVLGYAEAPGERTIIYEYVRAKTLETLLFGAGAEGGQLSWRARAQIAVGVARALDHLHASSALGVVHGRLKACNVFVEEGGRARVSDYGVGVRGGGDARVRGQRGAAGVQGERRVRAGGDGGGDAQRAEERGRPAGRVGPAAHQGVQNGGALGREAAAWDRPGAPGARQDGQAGVRVRRQHSRLPPHHARGGAHLPHITNGPLRMIRFPLPGPLFFTLGWATWAALKNIKIESPKLFIFVGWHAARI